MRIPDDDLLRMDGWPNGVNNRVRETESQAVTETRGAVPTSQFLREAINVDLTRFGHPLRRKGYTQEHAGFTHSLWSDPKVSFGLCVHEGWLTRIRANGTLEQVQEVHAYNPVSYATVNGEVFWSNGSDQGSLDSTWAGHWSLPVPPAVSWQHVAGNLTEGRYSISSVWVDEDDQEYGASTAVVVELPAQGGLELAAPASFPTGAAAIRFFMSQPNGEILYSVGVKTTPGSTLLVSASHMGRGRELETEELKPVRPGHIVRYFNGRVYVARNSTAFFTEPLRYRLMRPAQGMYMFPSKVTLLEPVVDGVFVGTNEGVVFLSGMDPYDVRQTNVLGHAPVPRAVTRVPGEFMDVPGSSDVPVWWGQDGAMVVGLPGGQVRQLSRDRIATAKFQAGAMLYREREGMAHVVSSLNRGGEMSKLAATDSVVAEVRHNTKQLNCW